MIHVTAQLLARSQARLAASPGGERRLRRLAVVRALAVLIGLFAAASGAAAPVCYDVDCAAACGSSWTNVTTLLDGSDFGTDPADTPIAFVDPADGLNHRFVATQEGKIWVWNSSTGNLLATPFLDLTAKVLDGGERGLLALAVDPQYATTGELYVYYTRDGASAADDGDIVVERYARLSAEIGDPSSAQTILVVNHPESNHNGGWLAFGPDGMLYISLGDGGNGCDQATGGPHGQNVSSLLGKLLRLDVRNADPASTAPECNSGDYEVPFGNPFAGGTGGCGEIWALGLRNPFRFSFDRSTGDIWIGDVGQTFWEEINYLPSDYDPLGPDGITNFGWKCREGCQGQTCGAADCGNVAAGLSTCEYPNDVDPGGGEKLFWDPVLCHENRANTTPGDSDADWQAVVGGYRYRGSQVPSLAGRYLYGDSYCGQIWRSASFSAADPAATTAACWDAGNGGLYSFAEDAQGELYLVFGDGRVLCVHNGAGCPWAFAPVSNAIFADGFNSGNTSAWSVVKN